MIARVAVMPAILASPHAQLVAVASRSSGESGQAASLLPGLVVDDSHALDDVHVHADYQGVLDDEAVEAVYIPLPNGLHEEWTKRCATAGKHVLCEKPLALDASAARAMATACSDAGVTLAEAYMTPFHPRSARLIDLARSGALGNLISATSRFTFPLESPGDHRWDPILGGGALADVGIYCLAPIIAIAGALPRQQISTGHFTLRGVDAWLSAWLDFADGFSGSITCAFDAPEHQSIEVVGTAASVRVERAFTPGVGDTQIELRHRDGTRTTIDTGGGDSYQLMIEDFARVVRGGTPARSVDEAIGLIGLVEHLKQVAQSR